MPFIVEDGTGLANAESYCTVAFADEYHDKRANLAWDLVQEKEAALRKATDYMIQAYRTAWKGYRVSAEQALDWPRNDVVLSDVYAQSQNALVPNDQVPSQVKMACAELAFKAASDELNPDLTQQVLSKTVGPISVTYDSNSPQQTRFRAIDMLLRPLMHGNGVSAKVRRV